MTEPTLAERTEMIAKMRAKIELLEQVEIPDAHEKARVCRSEGRYNSAADYMRLVWDLREDTFALQKCVDAHLDALARDECRPRPEAAQRTRSVGLTAERAIL